MVGQQSRPMTFVAEPSVESMELKLAEQVEIASGQFSFVVGDSW